MTTRIIDVRSSKTIPEDVPGLKPFEDMIWMSMLKSLSGYQMYRQSMQVRIRRMDVLKFLFCRTQFPRSVSYCIENMSYYFSNLPNNKVCQKHIEKIRKTLDQSTENTLDNEVLHTYIDDLQIQLANLHNDISKTYFPVLS